MGPAVRTGASRGCCAAAQRSSGGYSAKLSCVDAAPHADETSSEVRGLVRMCVRAAQVLARLDDGITAPLEAAEGVRMQELRLDQS
jgi:hypothetical protein